MNHTNFESDIMKLTPEQEAAIERQQIESVLHYMDEFPHSGQNREGAVIIRKLLASAPRVPAAAPIPDSHLKLITSLLGAAISDAGPSALRDVCIRVKNDLYGAIGGQVAPLVAVSGNAKPRKGLLWDSQWSNIVNHDHGYENFSKEDAVHHAVKLTEAAIARNLAGQVAPQATADIEDTCRSAWASFESDNGSDDLRYPGFRSIWLSGRTFGVEEDMEPQATVELIDELDLIYSILDGFQTSIARADGMNAVKIRALLATPPTSKATDGWNPNPGDNFGSAEHWKEKAQDWASYAEKLRKEIGGMVSAGELAKVNEALEKWISGVYVRHVKPVQSSVVPEARKYAESMHYAVTKQWISGWNDCRDYRLATSKADTGEIRNAALEEAATECDLSARNYAAQARGGDNSGASDHMETAAIVLAEEIRDMKSVTPITTEEPTVEQQIGTYREGWNNAVLELHTRCLSWAEARKAKRGGDALNNFAEEIYKQYAPLKSATPSTAGETAIAIDWPICNPGCDPEFGGHKNAACACCPATPSTNYADLERKHLGDPDKKTGVYALPPVPPETKVDTAPMYKALIESRLALLAVNSGASATAIELIDRVLNAAPTPSTIKADSHQDLPESGDQDDLLISDETLIACLGDDAARLEHDNPSDEVAATIRQAIARIERITTGEQS